MYVCVTQLCRVWSLSNSKCINVKKMDLLMKLFIFFFNIAFILWFRKRRGYFNGRRGISRLLSFFRLISCHSASSMWTIHTPISGHHRCVSSCRLYCTLGTRGFIFFCCKTLEPTSPDATTLSSIYWLVLQQFAVLHSVFFSYRFHQLYVVMDNRCPWSGLSSSVRICWMGEQQSMSLT